VAFYDLLIDNLKLLSDQLFPVRVICHLYHLLMKV
jgi:hypothetical protein